MAIIPTAPRSAMIKNADDKTIDKSDVSNRVLLDRYKRTQDPTLKAELVRHYDGLCRKLAWQYASKDEDAREDIYSECVLGILESLDTYDPNMGTKLMTWITWGAYSKALDYVRNKRDLLPVSRMLCEFNRLRLKIVDALVVQLMRSPSDAEIARAMCLPINRYTEYIRDFNNTAHCLSIEGEIDSLNKRHAIHFDHECRRAAGYTSVYSDVPDNLIDEVERNVLASHALDLLQKRHPRYVEFMRAFFFGNKGSGMTYKEVAAMYGVSESRVYQIVERSLQIIREEMDVDG